MKKELEMRLSEFSLSIANVVKHLRKNMFAEHLGEHIVNTCALSFTNYLEIRDAKSQHDYVQILNLILHDLRETNLGLRVIEQAELSRSKKEIRRVILESQDLISFLQVFLQSKAMEAEISL